MKKVFIICGPTSTGKTSLAIELAKANNGEIISFDSRQVYKHMDVGTGKLPVNSDLQVIKGEQKWNLDGVNVWGYDLVTPDKNFSAYDYAMFALPKARQILDAGKNLFLVGGTGFYIDTLTGKIKLSEVDSNWNERKRLQNMHVRDLYRMLESLDPKAVSSIDAKNKIRLVRAIEIARNLAKVKRPLRMPYLEEVSFVKIGLKDENAEMFERADTWLETVWSPLKTEVDALMNSDFKSSDKLKGLVYKEMLGFLKKELGEKEAKQLAKFSLHAYIRRQLTWFKKDESIEWFDTKSKDLIAQKVYNLINVG